MRQAGPCLVFDDCTRNLQKRDKKKQKAQCWSKQRLVLRGSSMTAYLSKQQSCFVDLDGRGDCEEVPYSFSWHPNSHHLDQHHHLCQRYHYGSVPRGAILPRRGGRKAAWHLDSTSRSPRRLAAVRAKGGSCDLWPSDCGCIHSWQEPYQVKLCCYQSTSADVSVSTSGSWVLSC